MMNRYLPFLFCLLLTWPLRAQELRLRALLKLQEMEQPGMNRLLQKKGWTFVEDSAPTDNTMGKAVWAYQPNGTGGAIAWCVRYYSPTSPTRILYNLSGGKSIARIRKQIRRRKIDVHESGNSLERVEALEQYADHLDGTHAFRLLRYQQPGYAGIKIFRRSDYLQARENGRL